MFWKQVPKQCSVCVEDWAHCSYMSRAWVASYKSLLYVDMLWLDYSIATHLPWLTSLSSSISSVELNTELLRFWNHWYSAAMSGSLTSGNASPNHVWPSSSYFHRMLFVDIWWGNFAIRYWNSNRSLKFKWHSLARERMWRQDETGFFQLFPNWYLLILDKLHHYLFSINVEAKAYPGIPDQSLTIRS